MYSENRTKHALIINGQNKEMFNVVWAAIKTHYALKSLWMLERSKPPHVSSTLGYEHANGIEPTSVKPNTIQCVSLTFSKGQTFVLKKNICCASVHCVRRVEWSLGLRLE